MAPMIRNLSDLREVLICMDVYIEKGAMKKYDYA